MAQRTKQRLDDVKLTLQRLQRITSESSEANDAGEDQPPVTRAAGRAALAWSERTATAAPPRKSRAPFIAAAGLGGVLAVGTAGFALWQMTSPELGETEKAAAVAIEQPVRAIVIAPDLPAMAPTAAPDRSDRAPAAAPDRPERAAAVAPNQPEKTAAIPSEAPPAARPAPVQRETPPNVARATAEAQEMIDLGKVSSARRILTDVAKQSPEAALMLARSYDPNFLRLVSEPDGAADLKEAERWYRIWHETASQNGLVMGADRLERIIKAMK